MPRIVFMGTPTFAVSALDVCLGLGEVVAVVTQPDKPKGRGQEVTQSPVKVRALEKGIPVLQPQKIRGTDFASELKQLKPDVAVVAAYGKILPKDVLEAPTHGCVNVHASLLPRFRGAAPIQWAIAEGDARTGVCLMKMDEGMDTGPTFATAEVEIAPDETSQTLFSKLERVGADLLAANLIPYLKGERPVTPQPQVGVVMAPMIRKEAGQVDFALSAAAIERRLRAFTPWPGLFTNYQSDVLKFLKVQVREGRGAPGEILRAGKEGIEIACGEGSVLVTQLQPPGKKPMDAQSFLASRKLEVGSKPFQ